MSMQSALRAHLLAASSITDLTSTRIYGAQAPEGVGFPRIHIQQISGDSTHHLGGESARAMAVYQIACYGQTIDSCQSVADAVRLRISGKRGTFGSGGNTATVESCIRSNSFTNYEDPVDGSAQRAVVGQIEEYTIHYTQATA